MLGLGCDLQPGLHHPDMTFRREDLLTGIEVLAKTVMKTFEKHSQLAEESHAGGIQGEVREIFQMY